MATPALPPFVPNPGCPPLPSFGLPLQPACGCDTGGGCGCGCGGAGKCGCCWGGGPCGGGTVSPLAIYYQCPCVSGTEGVPAFTAFGGGDALDAAQAFVRAPARFASPLDRTPGGGGPLHPCGVINPANGNLVLQVRPPAAGPLDFLPAVTYNSSLPFPIFTTDTGVGWTHTTQRKVSTGSGTAYVTTSEGVVYAYTGWNASTGYFTPPAGARNALKRATQFSPCVEVQPDGLEFHYDGSGLLLYMKSPAGGRWTLTRNGGGQVTQVLTPLGRRTTYAYDGNSNLMRVVDPGGRITSFTVNSNNDLARVTTPDGRITSLVYDTVHRLLVWQNPLGDRTSYGYDSSSRVQRITCPTGERTTYAYASNQTVRTDGRGLRATFAFNASDGTFRRVLDATGATTSYAWDTGQVRAVTDGRGSRATYSYLTASDQTRRLQAVQAPLGARLTFLYDGNNRVQGLSDPLGRRTTLLWDGSGNRAAVINALSQRTSYGYNAQGQLTAVTNALGGGGRCCTTRWGGGRRTSTRWGSEPATPTTPTASACARSTRWGSSPPWPTTR